MRCLGILELVPPDGQDDSMVDYETRQRQLTQRLGKITARADAQAIVDAAMKPQEPMARRMAEVVWDGLAADVKNNLGKSLEAFLEEQTIDVDE